MTKASTGVGRRPGDGRGRTLARFFLGGALFLGTSWAAWGAPPAVSKMLEYRPRHEVACTTPAAAQQADCKVELVKGAGGSGWALKDAQGRLVRKFYSSNGTSVDSYSYYRDGVEVYREVVSPGARTPDQFRWMNAGGSKWGVDEDRNGTIDSWKTISPEEVSQEILKALATRDLARLQALMLTDADIALLGIPAETAEAIKARRAGVKAKFEATIAKLTKLGDKAKWTHLETGVPQCLPADLTGAKADIYRHTRATVLFESGEANEWFQVGSMYLVGAAWKIIDAPSPGAGGETEVVENSGKGGAGIGIDDPKTLKLVEALTELDKKEVPTGAAAVAHHIARADLLEKIVAAIKAEQRDAWIRQLADSLSSAVQAGSAGDAPAVTRLDSLEKQLVKAMPGTNLTAYVAFRRAQSDYSVKLGKGEKNFNKVQEDWLVTLTGFVKEYPKAEDAADAMLQAGMVCEFLGKDAEAKTWYTQLVAGFKDKAQAAKAEGAIRRLSLEGDVMQVAAPLLKDPATPFDIASLKGKVVIVYYWASWNGQAVSDFAKLKAIAEANKEVEILSVNLDAAVDEAKAFVAKNAPVGTHLYQAGGLDSRPATQYGITVLPSLFLVGKDGKCVNKSAQLGMMDDEVKKLLKK
jgi:thiol-disulfide isomerase/thioredoxin